MKKVLGFLEGNVQWVALGLGFLYLAWVAWTFLVSSPVGVQVGGHNLGPGDIDKYIVDNPVRQLEGQMINPKVPTFPVPDWRAQFIATMEMKDLNPMALAGLWTTSAPVTFIASPGGGGSVPTPTGVVVGKFEKIPTIPAPELGDLIAGASNVDK